jgi:hypothetical protein
MTDREFVELVFNMRSLQKQYFKSRSIDIFEEDEDEDGYGKDRPNFEGEIQAHDGMVCK